MTVHVCTIVARNYLPQARVLATSVRAQHDDARVTVLVVDDVGGEVDDATEPFEVLGIDELEGDLSELRRMAVLYDVLEYSTALKPWLLRTLLARGSSAVVYLDPDIEVFDRLDEVRALAERHEVVLTPHVTSPMPRDGKMASETGILAAGIYNLGFVAVGRRSGAFLDYWSERLKRECVVQPQQMRFVDQRWVDFAPGIYDVAILRSPAYNVAYWNLDHRDLAWTGSRYTITSQPLKFFHFSGYSPRARHLLSKHQSDRPRILLSERPAIRRICNEYGGKLVACGFDEGGAGPPYRFGQMANGVPIDLAARRLFRDAVTRADAGKAPYPPDPFTVDGAEALTRWMNEIGEVHVGPARLTRYLAAVHAVRPDLQAAYPDPQGADYEHFLAWARHEVLSGNLDARLVPGPVGGEEEAGGGVGRRFKFAPSSELRQGFTIIGYLKAELGVGEWGRLATRAIESAGLSHATVVNTATTSRQEHPFEQSEVNLYDFDTNLLCVNADQLPYVRADLGEECFTGRYTIGQWAWELEEFPAQWSGSFDLVDEVWAISEFTRASLAAATTKPVYAIPPAIVEPTAPAAVDRPALGLPEDRFLFLFAFDLLSILERKNPLGLIDAFRQAFPTAESDGPVLVLKVINGDQRVADLERIKIAVIDRPDVLVIDKYFRADEHAALMSAADCYVSLHRSEGFGLTMAEAMTLGKPVIATGYSGNLDFMTADTAYLVRWTEGRVPRGCSPYREGARWAEPDLEHAAELLRKVFADPAEAANVGGQARKSVLEQHGLAARARLIRDRFDAIQRARNAHVALSDVSRVALPNRDLHELAAARPPLDAPAHHVPRLTRFYRRIVLRSQRHHDDHQRRVNVALAERVEVLGEEVAALRVRESDVASRLERQSSFDGRLGQIEGEFQTMQRNLTATIDGHESTMVGLQRGIEGLQAGALTDLFNMGATLQGQIREFQGQIRDFGERVQELRAIPFMDDPSQFMTTDASGRPAIGYRLADADARGAAYAGFEDVFRGSEDMIRDRQRFYVPVLAGQEPIVDVGCGRGELLDLLRVQGADVVGIDLDESMVERCQAKGHRVEQVDALNYLAKQADGAFGSVFSAQVIEHLSYAELVRFVGESYRALRKGGLFVAETVNPHAVPAFKTFWTDLTHRVPIFPEVAVSLCRSAGFEQALVVFPNGVGELDADRWQQGEYAVVATKLSD